MRLNYVINFIEQALVFHSIIVKFILSLSKGHSLQAHTNVEQYILFWIAVRKFVDLKFTSNISEILKTYTSKMYHADVYNVMIASPGDLAEERKVAQEIILDWNNINSSVRKIVLLPLSWEYNTIPEIGDRPQEIINKKILNNADILVGIFWTRIGTPTAKVVSGSVEEIEEHISLKKPSMLYFSNKPVLPDSIDSEQYAAVKKLKKEYQAKGLTNDFDSTENFRNQFQRHLSMKLNEDEYFNKLFDQKIGQLFSNALSNENVLSETAKLLIKEVSKDSSGQLIKVRFSGGFVFQTNNKQLNEDDSSRTKARWDSALNELLNQDLLEPLGHKGEMFRITQKGYDLEDTFN